MGSDLSIVMQTSVNAPDSIVQNHERIIASVRKSRRGSASKKGKRGESYTFEDDPMNYVELRVMSAADARACVNGSGGNDNKGGETNARAVSLERAGAGGNRVLMLEPSCDTNDMSGVSSDVAGMAARAKGYAALSQALKDPLMAGRVGIAVDVSAKLGDRIPAQSGRYAQCVSLLLANILLAAEGGTESEKQRVRYTLPGVTLYALDLRECGLTDESATWIVQDFMERVKRVFRYHVGLRLQQAQKRRHKTLFPGAAALTLQGGKGEDDGGDEESSTLRDAGGVKIQLPVFTKDTRGDLFCCSLQHILLAHNNMEIGGVLKVLNTLLESVAPKGYAPKGEDWMLLPYLCLVDLQKQDVLPSQIRHYLLEYVPPTRQVVILVSGTPEAEWKSTKEREEQEGRMGGGGGAPVARQSRGSGRRSGTPSGRRSTSMPRAKPDKPEDFEEVYLLQDRGPSLENNAGTDEGDETHTEAGTTAPSTVMNIDKEDDHDADSDDDKTSASSIAFQVEDGDSVAPAPPAAAPTPSNDDRPSTITPRRSDAAAPAAVDPNQQRRVRAEADAYAEHQRSRRQSLGSSTNTNKDTTSNAAKNNSAPKTAAAAAAAPAQDDVLQQHIRAEEAQLKKEQDRLEALRRERASTASAADAEAERLRQLRAERDEKLTSLQEQRRELQRQQREMYEEQEREDLEAQLARRNRRQLLPQDQQIVIVREKPTQRADVNKRELEERLQQLFEEEQAVYREYQEAEGDDDEDRERAYEERRRSSQRAQQAKRRERSQEELAEEARRWLRGDRSTPIFSASEPSTPSRQQQQRPSKGTNTPRRAEEAEEVPVNSAQPSPSAVRPSVQSQTEPSRVSGRDNATQYEPQRYESEEDKSDEEPQKMAKNNNHHPTAQTPTPTSLPAVVKRPPNRTPSPKTRVVVQTKPTAAPAATTRSTRNKPTPQVVQQVAPEPIDSEEEEEIEKVPPPPPLESPQEGEERTPQERLSAYPPDVVDLLANDDAADAKDEPEDEDVEEAEEEEEEVGVVSPVTSLDRSTENRADAVPEPSLAPRTAPTSLPAAPVSEDRAPSRAPISVVSVSTSRSSFVSPHKASEADVDAEEPVRHADDGHETGASVTPPRAVANASRSPPHQESQPSIARSVEAPFHDPGMRSLRPSGPQYGIGARPSSSDRLPPPPALRASPPPPPPQPQQQPQQQQELPVVPALEAASFAPSSGTPGRNGSPAVSPYAGSSVSPSGAHVDPNDVYLRDPELARERERRAARFRDHRYDSVSPRVDNRWDGGRDGPTPPPEYDRIESPRKRAQSPKVNARVARGPTSEVRTQSPHPGRGSSSSIRPSAPPRAAAPPAAADAPRRTSSSNVNGAAPGTPRSRGPLAPPQDTAASRARRAASQQRRRALEEEERTHPIPHQPRINRGNGSARRGSSGLVDSPANGNDNLEGRLNSPSYPSYGLRPSQQAISPSAPTSSSNRRTTNTMDAPPSSASWGREESPVPKPVMVNARDMMMAASTGGDGPAASVYSSAASAHAGQQSNLVDTPYESRGLRPGSAGTNADSTARGGIEAPPGWELPMVNPKLRTQRPSSHRR